MEGGLLVSTQDIDASGMESVLLTEASGRRGWLIPTDRTTSTAMLLNTGKTNYQTEKSQVASQKSKVPERGT